MPLAHPRRRGLTSPLNAAARQPRARLTPSWNTNRVGDDNVRRRGNKTNTFTLQEPCVDAFRTHFCTPELIAGRYADPARYKLPSKQLRARDTYAPTNACVRAAVEYRLDRMVGVYIKRRYRLVFAGRLLWEFTRKTVFAAPRTHDLRETLAAPRTIVLAFYLSV